MNPPTKPAMLRWSACAVALCATGASNAFAQEPIVFGVDWHGPTKSAIATGGTTPISEADLLVVAGGQPVYGPVPRPSILLDGGQIGLSTYTVCVGAPSGTPCGSEIDAISFGNEGRFRLPGAGVHQPRLFYSVDRFAVGSPTATGSPTVRSEAQAREASSDVFTTVAPLNPPVPPSGVLGSTGVIDGNGLVSATSQVYPGLGLVEPNSIPPGPLADAGDNLDALNIGPIPSGPGAALYYSLDGSFVDPATGQANSGSAQLNGFSPAAVIRKPLPSGSATVYATPSQLGLHPLLDDLDGLILWDNGDGVFQPSQQPFDWVPPGSLLPLPPPTDMLLYSVRRGSQIIGQTDSLQGLPIEPGDVLTTPVAGGNGNPAIFIAAEALGLATQRTNGVARGDDLDAISADDFEPYYDCNHNGTEDSVDIATGASADTNNNNVPDECEQGYGRYCQCDSTAPAPCGNFDATAGCQSSLLMGGLLDASGTTSVTTDDLVLTATQLPPGTSTLFFMGPNQTRVAFGDGLRCVANPVYRFGVQFANGSGSVSLGSGIRGLSCAMGSGCISSGSTWNFQVWYRNAASWCTSATFNLTNGVSVPFTP